MSQEPAPARRFDPGEFEPRILELWREGGYFETSAADVENGAEPFVIVIPPPNVTAVLHMGHALNASIQDVLIRWMRMRGRAALWVPGTDHAGIATQNVVERRLAAQGRVKEDLGREAFVERVQDYVDETGAKILEQLRLLGCSCDWSRCRFTLDEGLSAAVREVFVRLYEDGLIYRGEYIINWCPRCLTALSNEEAEGREQEGALWSLAYPLEEGPGVEEAARRARSRGASAVAKTKDGWTVTVSTTRPETMLGDTGVAVHPDDARYAPLAGLRVRLPLAGRSIPIVQDSAVDPEFGTGLVKVTPAHDALDFEIARRTKLPLLNIMTREARMSDAVPPEFRGLDRAEARKEALRRMEDLGLLGETKPHSHTVPFCYRCGTVIEPRLSKQWFVRMKPLAERALRASLDGEVVFAPDRWTLVYRRWMEEIRDWCISRQLWWGHRIPVWYCRACGEVIVSREDPKVCPACGSDDPEQDPDVLDTWFSSWLWPFSVFGWPKESRDLKLFYPGHVLSTAPEILFFWVARMIMAGCRMIGPPPFSKVYLHGTVRDARGRKMSKSLGNGIDPLEVIRRHGADALRFTLLRSAGVGADIRLDHKDLESAFAPGRNFVNKLWNAGRFVQLSAPDGRVKRLSEVGAALRLEDRWILSRTQRAAAAIGAELEAFRIQGALEVAGGLFRGDFADWYLEWIKGRVGEDDAAGAVLVRVFETICRLLHPVTPFVTEELWRRLPEQGPKRGALAAAQWPNARSDWIDAESEKSFGLLQELVSWVRRARKDYRVPEGARTTLEVGSGSLGGELFAPEDGLGEVQLPLGARRLARISAAGPLRPESSVGASGVLSDGTRLFLPLEGVLDLDIERKRLAKEVEEMEGRLKGARAKLANPNFVSRAPAEVVERERRKAAAWAGKAEQLRTIRRSLRED